MSDYYELLNVAKDATDDEIRTNYRHLAMQWHPDRNNGSKEAEEKFKEISEAYSVLSDPDKRRAYDARPLEETWNANWGSSFTPEQATYMFLNEMYKLATEMTMHNVKWNEIARALIDRGCPESVARSIAKQIETRRKALIRSGAKPYFWRSAVSVFFGLMVFTVFGGFGLGILGFIGLCLFLSGAYNLFRALYFFVTGNAPRS
jgi:curved DNA-binding protein CbpA